MTIATSAAGSLDGYQLRLPVYEGPLDVLLRLIERDQLAITDVSLVAVTEQFLSYVANLSDVAPQEVAEFAAIAARLLVLKSRSLLPVAPPSDDEIEEDDLAQQLITYQAVKLAAEALRSRESEGWRAWSRMQPPPADLPREDVLVPSPLPSLVRALRRCVNRAPARPTAYRPAPVVTLASMTRRLLNRLGFGQARLTTLVGHSATRSEYAVAFIALLTLLRQRIIDVRQATLFGDIEIERREAFKPADD